MAEGPGELLIVDNDFGGDPDGLVSLAHILLRRGPEASVLVTASPLDPGLAEAAGADPAATASHGLHLAEYLVELMGLNDVRVIPGAEATGTTIGQLNAAAGPDPLRGVHPNERCGGRSQE